MMFRLIALTGNIKGQRITVTNDPMTIGRDTECSISLADNEVASKHALIEHSPVRGLHIKDLGSMNKILVNNIEVRQSHLKHGDIIEIGRNRFLVQATVETDLTKKAPYNRLKHLSPAPLLIIVPLLAVIYAILSFCHKIMREPSPSIKSAYSASNNVSSAQARASIPSGKRTNPKTEPDTLKPLSDELRQVRAELVGIKQTVSELSLKPGNQSNTVSGIEQKQPAPAVNAEPNIKIAYMEQQKFKENEDFDEMRVLTVGLQRQSPAGAIQEDSVRVEVLFFDQTADAGSIVPTRAVVPAKPLKPAQWMQDTQTVVTAAYVIPKGAREKYTEQFYGYVVRVYYHDKLQDEDARPRPLLNYSSGTIKKQELSSSPGKP